MSVITIQSAIAGIEQWRNRLVSSGRSVATPSSAPQTEGSGLDAQPSPAALMSSIRSDLQKSLNQGWQDYMQKLRVDLSRPVKRQSAAADQMDKQLLKQRVDALRQMMMTRDKAGLRALASQLAQLARELKSLVASMTQNAADQQMAVSLGGAADQPSVDSAAASAQDASPGQDHAADDAQAASSAEAAAVASASASADASPVSSAALAGGNATQEPASQADAPAGSSDAAASAQQGASDQAAANAADPQAALRNMLAHGNPVAADQDIQEMLLTLKMVQAFIKQMALQLQAQEERKMKEDQEQAGKALQDVDTILKGGPEALAALSGQMDVNVSAPADASSTVA
ncbi:hypothetical protein JFK97_09840 [Chromobacterium phragmitis]|uniref:hypothetical protein n=1 Tax=Chromobacterium amazonense TaxID=1382803 RepID=UPI0021B716D5|nr:hypothetical protein [Chromobacterium amazonense]MBM2884687.1 hypothetical protein [Chromobacterium amazonense]